MVPMPVVLLSVNKGGRRMAATVTYWSASVLGEEQRMCEGTGIATFEAVTAETVPELAELAGKIWFEYWPALIGADQTAYMVEQFQSRAAIECDMREHAYEYWFVRATDDGRVVGYTGGHVEPETNRFFVSKIYLLAEERGKHFASAVVRFYEQLCRDRGLQAMYLTVNKGNKLGIRAYEGNGFTTIDAVKTDIGQGFIMDDCIMEKRVG